MTRITAFISSIVFALAIACLMATLHSQTVSSPFTSSTEHVVLATAAYQAQPGDTVLVNGNVGGVTLPPLVATCGEALGCPQTTRVVVSNVGTTYAYLAAAPGNVIGGTVAGTHTTGGATAQWMPPAQTLTCVASQPQLQNAWTCYQ